MDYENFFYCLSVDPNPDRYIGPLRHKVQFTSGDLRSVLDQFITYYDLNGHFPDFTYLGSVLGQDLSSYNSSKLITEYGSVESAMATLWSKFCGETELSEIKSVESRMVAEIDPVEKQKLLREYNRLMAVSRMIEGLHLVSDTDLPMEVSAEVLQSTGILHPINKLNEEIGTTQPGQIISILGGPGSFKTTYALETLYQNSVLRDRHGLYIHLEDMAIQYQKKIFSRSTYSSSDRIHKDILLKGTDDEYTKELVARKWEEYKKTRKGKITYSNLAGAPMNPDEFGPFFAKVVDENEVDYVIFDYAQCILPFKPPRVDKYEFMNNFFLTLGALALGNFDNRQFTLILLSQTTKESLKKIDARKGAYTIGDAAEISALERMSFEFISLYCNDMLKAGGQVQYQLLKARNAMTIAEPVVTTVIPEYSFLGDIPDLQDIYNPNAVQDSFGGGGGWDALAAVDGLL